MLVKIMNERRGNMSYDTLARQIGIQTAVIWRFLTQKRGLSVQSIRRIAAWATKNNDQAVLRELIHYALYEDEPKNENERRDYNEDR